MAAINFHIMGSAYNQFEAFKAARIEGYVAVYKKESVDSDKEANTDDKPHQKKSDPTALAKAVAC